MSKFFKDLLTEKDGETFELQRVFLFVSMWICVAAFVVGCIYEGWHVHRSGDFDLPSFFQGISYLLVSETVLLGGGAASIFFKMKSETDSSNPPQPKP